MDPRTTLFIVSSKSGATLETMSLFRYFWEEMLSAGDNRGHHFIAITDQGTPLARLASERGFRRLFVATPDVGGRYSALTAFGLVPAALIGVDVEGLLDRSFMRVNGMSTKTPGEVDGLVLGSALGELAISGRDKVTFISSPSVRSFPSWIEQLIAESTGKDGRGMVPITGEPPLEPSSYLPDRFFIGLSVRGEGDEVEERMERLEDAGHPTVQMMLEDKLDLGGAIFDLELAVASAATVLGIHPFNQPDVQMTKDMVKKMVVDGRLEEGAPGDVEVASINDPDELRNALREWLSQARRGDYISIQAYLGPDDEVSDGLQQLRSEILYDLNLATALDHGPQFLHSTGQLQGGPQHWSVSAAHRADGKRPGGAGDEVYLRRAGPRILYRRLSSIDGTWEEDTAGRSGQGCGGGHNKARGGDQAPNPAGDEGDGQVNGEPSPGGTGRGRWCLWASARFLGQVGTIGEDSEGLFHRGHLGVVLSI